MLEDIIQPKSEVFSIEDISSQIAAQIFDFCDDDTAGSGDLYPPPSADPSNHLLFHSPDEVSSSSATTTVTASNTANTNTTATTTGPNSPLCCYADDASFSTFASLDAATLSALLDAPPPTDPEHDFPSSANSSSRLPAASHPTATYPGRPAYHQQDPFDQMALTDAFAGGYTPYCPDPNMMTMAGNQQQVMYEEECYAAAAAAMQQTASFMGLDAQLVAPSQYGFLEGNGTSSMGSLYQQGGGGMGMGDSQGFFDGGGMMAARMEAAGGLVELAEYQKMENAGLGLFGQDSSMQRAYSSSDVQVISRCNQHLLTGCSNSAPGLSSAEIPNVDDPTFKVGRLSVEERKEKIHRYMKKRNERNFSKKIKYACRKTLADSRPRVRGRFAKNDEFGETSRPSSSNHEFDDEEEVVVKEEDDMLESSDILAHISGLNSFKYSYSPNIGYEPNGLTDASLGYCPL